MVRRFYCRFSPLHYWMLIQSLTYSLTHSLRSLWQRCERAFVRETRMESNVTHAWLLVVCLNAIHNISTTGAGYNVAFTRNFSLLPSALSHFFYISMFPSRLYFIQLLHSNRCDHFSLPRIYIFCCCSLFPNTIVRTLRFHSLFAVRCVSIERWFFRFLLVGINGINEFLYQEPMWADQQLIEKPLREHRFTRSLCKWVLKSECCTFETRVSISSTDLTIWIVAHWKFIESHLLDTAIRWILCDLMFRFFNN